MRDKGPMVDFCFYIISSLVSKLTGAPRGIWLRGTDFVPKELPESVHGRGGLCLLICTGLDIQIILFVVILN